MLARIYQPARNAMQSGQAKSRTWILEFDPADARKIDPLMGWTSSSDTQSQVKLRFDTREAAEKYAQAHGIEFILQPPHKRRPVIRRNGYGDNFATNRRTVWTH
ncbi:MAG: ETC complex I subunit [Paracoccaceae bacterium]|nr:ETC complex I subunit [Paracoccaceae bacterium]